MRFRARRQWVGLRPQFLRNNQRLDAQTRPPLRFFDGAMHLAMMHPAERHRELIADLATERPGLREAQMMGIGGLAAAYDAGLRRDKFAVDACRAAGAVSASRRRLKIGEVGAAGCSGLPHGCEVLGRRRPCARGCRFRLTQSSSSVSYLRKASSTSCASAACEGVLGLQVTGCPVVDLITRCEAGLGQELSIGVTDAAASGAVEVQPMASTASCRIA